MNNKLRALLSTLLLCTIFSTALADTPPPGTVELKGATDSTKIGNVGASLDVNVTNSIPVTIPTPVPVVASTPLPVLQFTPPWSVSRTWTESHSTDSISSWLFDSTGAGITSLAGSLNVNVTDFPSTYTVVQPTGTNLHVTVDNTIPVTIPTPLPVVLATPLPAGSNTIGAISNTSFTATQATGSNLHTVVDSGTVTANIGTTNGLALDSSIQSYLGSASGGTAAAKSTLFGGIYNSSLPTLSSGQQSSLQLDSSGRIIIRPLTSADVVSSLQSGTWNVGLSAGSNLVGSVKLTDGTNTASVSSGGGLIVSGLSAVGTAPANNPIGVSGVDGGGLKRAFLTDTSGRVEVDTVQSLPLPLGASTLTAQNTGNTSLATIATNTTGVSTSALQTAGNSSLSTIATNTTPLAQGSTTSGQSGTLTQGAVTTAAPTYTTGQTNPLSLKTTGDLRTDSSIADSYLSTIATNTGTAATDITTTGTITALNGAVSISGQGVYTTTFSITGTWTATLVVEGQTPDSNWTALPINIVSNSLPYYTASNITSNGTYLITGGGFTNIRVRASAFTSGTVAVAVDGSLAQQTVIANINTPDQYVVGASAQTAIVNNILTPSSGTSATSTLGYKSGSVQVVSTGTGGTFIFEGSNDGVNFQTIPVYSQLILTGTPITAAITATASQSIYTFPISVAYIRLRIVTAITGGSIQAFTKLSQVTWTPAVFQVAQATGANLNVGTVSTVTSVTSVAADSLAANTATNDLVSVAKTATFTLAITPAAGQMAQSFELAVTASSGTNQTLDCSIIETYDSAATYTRTVYQFERVTGVLATPLVSPMIKTSGNRFEYSCVIGGTTPSFTMALWRVGSQLSAPINYRIFDRNIVPTTLNSTSTALNIDGCSQISYGAYNSASTGTVATFDLQLSEDGTVYENQATTVAPANGLSQSIQGLAVTSKFGRLIVTAAGSSETLGYAWLRCTGN